MGQYAVTLVIDDVLLVFIIHQQVRTRPINRRQSVVVPASLSILGILNLDQHPPASATARTLLAASVVTALVFGVPRGLINQIWWSPDRVQLRKGSLVTLLLWIVAIAVRIVIAIFGHREGVPTSVSTGEIPLFLGITLAAQNLVIWQRAQAPSLPGTVTS